MTVIRQTCAEDMPAVHAVLREAFPTDAEARLVEALASDTSFIPELSLVAIRDGAAVGYALLTRAQIAEEGAPAAGVTPALCLAPVAVVPRAQGGRVGISLIRAGLQRARERGERVVLVLGHPGYYPRFGFVPAGSYGIGAPYEVPSEAWMALELVPGALTEAKGTARLAAPFDDPEFW